jgi:hypothetical protein
MVLWSEDHVSAKQIGFEMAGHYIDFWRKGRMGITADDFLNTLNAPATWDHASGSSTICGCFI